MFIYAAQPDVYRISCKIDDFWSNNIFFCIENRYGANSKGKNRHYSHRYDFNVKLVLFRMFFSDFLKKHLLFAKEPIYLLPYLQRRK